MLNMFNTPHANTINKDLCYYIPCTYLPEEGHYYLSEIYDRNNRTAQFYCEPNGAPVESYALRPDHLFPADVRITKDCYVITFMVKCIPHDEVDDEYICECHIDRIVDDTLYYIKDKDSCLKTYLKAQIETHFNGYSIEKAVNTMPQNIRPICVWVLDHLIHKEPLEGSIYTKEVLMKPYEQQ